MTTPIALAAALAGASAELASHYAARKGWRMVAEDYGNDCDRTCCALGAISVMVRGDNDYAYAEKRAGAVCLESLEAADSGNASGDMARDAFITGFDGYAPKDAQRAAFPFYLEGRKVRRALAAAGLIAPFGDRDYRGSLED